MSTKKKETENKSAPVGAEMQGKKVVRGVEDDDQTMSKTHNQLIGSTIFQVQNLSTEIEQMKEVSNPEDIYLSHCEQFAKQNLFKLMITIEQYVIDHQDILNMVFAEYNDDDLEFTDEPQSTKYLLKKQYEGIDQEKKSEVKNVFTTNPILIAIQKSVKQSSDILQKHPIPDYQIMDIKILQNIFLINDRQQIVIKTWEKVRHKLTNLTFQIKSLRIFDNQNKLQQQILTEQVDGLFSQSRFYDASTLFFKNFLYYFKRIQKYQPGQEKSINQDQEEFEDLRKKQSQGSRKKSDQDQLEDLRRQSQRSQKKSDQNLSLNSSYVYSDSYSYLQLFRYDFVKNEESAIDDYLLIEYSEMNEGQTYNIIFSQQFGNDSQIVYDDEQAFLNDQYFIAQQYIENNEQKSFGIFKMDNLEEPLYHEMKEDEIDSPNTEEVIFLNHFTYEEMREQRVLFVMISKNKHMHLVYDPQTQDCEELVTFKSDEIQKQLVPEIHVQNMNIDVNKGDSGELVRINQKFFIDFKNLIQLIHPNYKIKSEKFQIIDIVQEQLQLKKLDFKKYKRINVKSFKKDCNGKDCDQNVIHSISHLKKILNYKQIKINQIFTFCKDPSDQVIYISQSDLTTIILLIMRDHHCEELFNSQEQELLDQKQFQSKAISSYLQSKKALTRQKRIDNYLKDRLPMSYILFRKEGQESSDLIEINIDTQQIIITKKLDFHNQQQNSKDKNKKKKQVNITANRLLNQPDLKYVQIEGKQSKMQKILAFSTKLFNIEILNLELIMRNLSHYVFVLSAINYINGQKKMTYIFVRKTLLEITDLIQDSMNDKNQFAKLRKSLMMEYQQIQVMCQNLQLKDIIFKEFYNYQLTQEQSNIRINFEKLCDINEPFGFVAMLYQENTDQQKNQLLIYDIEKMIISEQISINPIKNSQKYILKDDQGYNMFRIVRSSDVLESKSHAEYIHLPLKIKFQVYTFFNEKLGRIQIQEYIIRHKQFKKLDLQSEENQKISSQSPSPDYFIQLIGQKQILMSLKCIQQTDWIEFQKSQVIPFLDADLNHEGSELIMQFGKNRQSSLNLVDQKKNNLYTYASEILLLGQKRFELSKDDPEDFLIVITVKMRDNITDSFIFDQTETYAMLRKILENILEMRRPDLEYILLNTFESLIKTDFFNCQEILNGKSLCDICLGTPKMVQQALTYFLEQDQEAFIDKTLVAPLIRGDNIRKEFFKDIQFYPKSKIINFDFSFNTTVYRALKLNANKSLSLLQKFIFNDINSSDYNILIMMDLPELLERSAIDIYPFFNETEFQQKALERGQFCLIESQIKSENIEMFSHIEKRFLEIENILDVHDAEPEIINKIIERDNLKKLQKNPNPLGLVEFTVEHSYIDFKWLAIGEKLKHMDESEDEAIHKLTFDAEYFSDMLMKQEDNLEFYGLKSVQKLIDFFYVYARIQMVRQFFFYTIFFVFPYCITLVTDDKNLKYQVLKVCLFPQTIMLTIEIFQMYENGWSYFAGWNLIDLTQIILFVSLFIMRTDEQYSDRSYEFAPFIKMILVFFTFIKTVHLVTVYEEFGFFVKMLEVCTIALFPFILSFMSFSMLFTVMYCIMGVEIVPDLVYAQENLGFFGTLFLSVFMNAVGRLVMTKYDGLILQPPSTFKTINFYLIHLIFFVQVMFQLLVGVNFMIAIIDQSYRETLSQREMFLYRNKAELNQECYQLVKWLKKLQKLRLSIFTYQIQDNDDRIPGQEEFNYSMGKVEQQFKLSMMDYKFKYSNNLFENILISQNKSMESFGKISKDYLNQISTFKKEMLDLINSKKKKMHSNRKK